MDHRMRHSSALHIWLQMPPQSRYHADREPLKMNAVLMRNAISFEELIPNSLWGLLIGLHGTSLLKNYTAGQQTAWHASLRTRRTRQAAFNDSQTCTVLCTWTFDRTKINHHDGRILERETTWEKRCEFATVKVVQRRTSTITRYCEVRMEFSGLKTSAKAFHMRRNARPITRPDQGPLLSQTRV